MNKDIRSKDLYKIIRQIELINHQIQVIQNHIFNTQKSSAIDNLLNVREASNLMRISTSRIYVLAGLDFIPSKRVGSRLLFDKNELVNLIENGFKVTTAMENERRKEKNKLSAPKIGRPKKQNIL
jgi:hypothetical protein